MTEQQLNAALYSDETLGIDNIGQSFGHLGTEGNDRDFKLDLTGQDNDDSTDGLFRAKRIVSKL